MIKMVNIVPKLFLACLKTAMQHALYGGKIENKLYVDNLKNSNNIDYKNEKIGLILSMNCIDRFPRHLRESGPSS